MGKLSDPAQAEHRTFAVVPFAFERHAVSRSPVEGATAGLETCSVPANVENLTV